MNQRSALLIAAAITAFLLVLAGGLASRLSTTANLGATEVAAAPTEPPTVEITLDPTVEALIQEREASYQQALAEANSRLNEANAQIAQANAQISSLEQSRQQLAEQINAANQSQAAVAAPVAVAAAAPAAAPSYAISPEQARDIALGAAPGASLLSAPELVRYEGSTAYEVSLATGKVYVDAQSGEVLANGAAAAQLISQEQAIQAAQAYLGGGTVKSIDLEDENGAQTYRVKFSDDSKIYVDAVTGAVVYAEIRTSESQYARGDDDEHEGHEGHDEHEDGEHEGGDDD